MAMKEMGHDSRHFQLYLSDVEDYMLFRLGEIEGVSKEDVVKQLIRDAYTSRVCLKEICGGSE